MGGAMSGGCQCGAVRYRAARLNDDAHVCHCRMCRKAVGNLFVGFVSVSLPDFSWTRGAPAVFYSSAKVARGFCGNCGAPLFYRHDDGGHIAMTIGSFDQPQEIALAYQSGMEGRLPQVGQLPDLVDHGTTEEKEGDWAAEVKTDNRQHPDHDTDAWQVK